MQTEIKSVLDGIVESVASVVPRVEAIQRQVDAIDIKMADKPAMTRSRRPSSKS